MTRIAVVIPVGPEEHHAAYLDEAIESVYAQSRQPDCLVVVDDMHGRDLYDRVMVHTGGLKPWKWVRPPWRLGVGHAFNHGVAAAFNQMIAEPRCDLALMLGADDRLEPRVLEHLEAAYEAHHAEGFYWLDVIYSDGEEQGLPCNAAAFTRDYFRETGGLPIEASSGGMDAAFVSAMLVHRPRSLHHVRAPEARYWVRRHAQQEGARLNAYWDAMVPIRDVFTREWRPTTWGRYE